VLLSSVNHGREGAFGEIIEQVYDDLRRVASHRMKRAFHRDEEGLQALTRQPTEIVDDAVMDLLRQHAQWKNTEQFFAIATRLMLRVIVDYQRQRMAQKRGGGDRGASLTSGAMNNLAHRPEDELIQAQATLRVQETMSLLNEVHPRQAEVMTMHVVCGLSQPRVAELLGVSTPTVERDLRLARAWLKAKLEDDRIDDS